jgi:hypothetical protein
VRKANLRVVIVHDIVYYCCILHNLAIKQDGMPFNKFMWKMTIDVPYEMQQKEQGQVLINEEEKSYNGHLQQGEVLGNE